MTVSTNASESVALSRAAIPRLGGKRAPFVRSKYLDVLLAILIGGATFVVHNVGYMLSLPFWTDEAWVAISTKLPLHDLLRVTSSTPAGWTLLLRLVFIGGEQRLRIVPLLFAAATVVVAFLHVRRLPWPSVLLARLAAVLAGAAALLVPSALARDDLKQYTADAFVTLLILLLAAHVESSVTRRRLVTLGVVVVIGFLFSAVAAFAGAAAFGSILLVLLLRRSWRVARDAAICGAGAGVLLIVIFLVLYRPGIRPGLTAYWADYYVPIHHGFGPSWQFLLAGARSMAGYLGMGPLVVVALLIVAGEITLVRLRRPALAIIVPVLLVEMIVLSAAEQYPLFDLRTSHFLSTALGVTAAIGVAGLCVVAARVHVGAALVVAVLVAGLFIANVKDGFRARVINTPAPAVEDLRTPTDYVSAHVRPDDIIVVNELSSWGFAYYWGKGTPAIETVTANLQQFVTVFPDQPNILVATDRTPAAVQAVMDRATVAAAKIGPGARIWVIHDHLTDIEAQAFLDYQVTHGLVGQNIIANTLVLLTPTAS